MQKTKMAMEMGPKKIGLTIKVCFLDAVFLLFKNAASSNKHHNLSLVAGASLLPHFQHKFHSAHFPKTKLIESTRNPKNKTNKTVN